MKREIHVALRKGLLIGALALAQATIIGGAQATATSQPGAPAPLTGSTRAALAALPLNFEENFGQAGSADVQYLAHGRDYGIALTQQGALLTLGSGQRRGKDGHALAPARLRVLLQGAQASPAPRAEQALAGRVNYLVGNDPSKWRTDVATYGKVRYAAVYRGVDLVYYGNQGRLEYDFEVAPGANPAAIGVRMEGAQRLHLDTQGNLQIQTHDRQIGFERPVAYQMDGQERKFVAASYRLAGRTVRFRVGAYDHSKPLIIDPILNYLSYLGGSGADIIGTANGGYGPPNQGEPGQAAAIDGSGNLYVVGYTYSTNLPVAGGLAPPSKAGTAGTFPTVFVSKIAPNASSLVYSTYLGGSYYDYGFAIAVDAQGSAYVTGTTFSYDFPSTAGAFQTICSPFGNPSQGEHTDCDTPANANAQSSAFVTKLSPAGNALVYSTFLGNAGTVGYAIAVDGSGNAYVAGTSPATLCAGAGIPTWNCFPTTAGALQADGRSGDDQAYAFVTVFDPTGSGLRYSTLYGDKNQIGTSGNLHSVFPAVGTAIAVDSAGNFYLAGQTEDGQLPTTSGSYQPIPGPLQSDGNNDIDGGFRGFVAKFSPVGGASPPTQIYATYIGGRTAAQTWDAISGIAVDASGDVYIYGATTDTAFPVTTGAYQATFYGITTYIAELDPTGSQLLRATYFGGLTGNGDSIGFSGPIVLDAAGNVYVTGQAASAHPQVNPIQAAVAGACCSMAFVSELDPTLSNLLFSSLVGNGAVGATSAAGIAVDGSGNIYLAGNVGAVGTLAATPGVFQGSFGGRGSGYSGNYGDGFVAKISTQVTDYVIPWFTEYPGYVSRFVFLNSGTSAGTYSISVLPEPGNAAQVNASFASGTISPKSQLVVNASDLVSFFTLSPRAAAHITIDGTNPKVSGIYNLVQPSTGSITNTRLLPGLDFSSTTSLLQAPFFTTGSSYSSSFVFSNTSQSAVTGQVTLLPTVANPVIPNPTTFQIPPQGEFVLPATNLVSGYTNAAGPLTAGAVFSFSAPEGYVKGVYKIVSNSSGGVGTSELVNPQTATASPTTLIAPWFTTYPGYSSTFYLVNRSNQDASLTISVRTEQGNAAKLGTTSWTLPANSQLALPAASIVSSFTGNTRGAAVFTINGPSNEFEGLYQVINLATGAMSNTPMSRPSDIVASTPFVLPWFTTYPGYVSRFVFLNRSTQDAPFTVQVLPELNNTATLNVTSGIIPAGSMYVLNASDLVTGFSEATRAGAVFQVSSPDSSIDALYNVVNPASGVISNTLLTH